jgi:hypothetical protein
MLRSACSSIAFLQNPFRAKQSAAFFIILKIFPVKKCDKDSLMDKVKHGKQF